MQIDLLTLFPEMCEAVLGESILGRARKAGKITISAHNIRDFAEEKRKGRVDDTCYGGGKGMVLQAEPIYRCFAAVAETLPEKPHVIYMSPQGATLTQQKAVSLSKIPYLILICGHYEGVDERLLEEIVDEEISIGDYVLTGGELPALVLADTIARLCDGVLTDPSCYEEESHFGGLLEYPQYTRPEIWHGKRVPEVLLSGHHQNIAAWRQAQRLLRTAQKRPELFANYSISAKEQKLFNEIDDNSEKQ